MEMRDEVLSRVGAQDMDIIGYHVVDLDGVEFCWENDQLNVHVVFRPGIDTPFSSSTFYDFRLCSMVQNPILMDKEQCKENSPPPTTPVSEIPTQPTVLMRGCPIRTRIENVPDYVYRKLFE